MFSRRLNISVRLSTCLAARLPRCSSASPSERLPVSLMAQWRLRIIAAMIQRWTLLTGWLGTSTFASFYPALRVLPVIAKHTVAALVSFGSLHRHRVIIHSSFIWFLAFSVYNHRVVTRSSLSCLAAVNVDTALAAFPQPPALTV